MTTKENRTNPFLRSSVFTKAGSRMFSAVLRPFKGDSHAFLK